VTLKTADGRPLPAAISTAVLRDAKDRIVGGVATFRDLNKVQALLHQVEALDPLTVIVTTDPALKRALGMLPTIAASDTTALIEGESGTGKGLVARVIHQLSPRQDGPFVTVNCGALPDTLFESELFGYKAGAFTGAVKDKPGRVALAQGGTLFLDEIGDLPLSAQVKVLRLLHEKTYEPLGGTRTLKADVRIVAATNRDLAALVKEGRFREDLFYRINVVRIAMPPLRARLGDVAHIAERFVRQTAARKGKRIDGVSPEAVSLLMRHDYPGNVRELENILEYACLFCPEPLIRASDLPEWLVERVDPPGPSDVSPLDEAEARALREALARTGWNRAKAAAALGIHKTTLHRKIRRLGLVLPVKRGRSRPR
jgi:transcriptional regulator with PAS, ATPase and Fis domain